MALVFSGLTIPPAPSLNSAGKGAAERQITAAGSRSVVPLVYGRDRLGGLVLNVLPAGTGSSTLLVQVLWSFACDGLEDVRWSDQPLPAGATVTHYLGTQTTPDAALVAAFAAQSITYTSTLNGYCYSVFAIPVRLFSGELAFSATIRGERVYDPRQDSTNGGSGSQRLATPSTWTWSDNPALALADLLRDTTYGAGRTVNWASVITAANHCDALIGSPAEKRRTVGVSFATATELAAAVDSLRAYAGCFVLPGASGITLLPDQHGSPVATYSHASGEIASIEPLTLRDLRGVPTVVEVVYTDTSKLPWRDASATASLPGAGSTRPYRLQQLRMPGVQRYSQALREATERLNKLTLGDMATVVEVFDIGIRHEVGDIVSITHPVGISAKSFRVASPPEMVGLGRWRLPLVEHDSAFYSTTVATAPTVPDTSLLNPAGPPSNVAGLTATAIQGAIRITWTPAPDLDYATTELRRGPAWDTAVRLDTGASGQSLEVAASSYDWAWPAVGAYTIWARHRDMSGTLSATPTSLGINVAAGDIAIIDATNALARVAAIDSDSVLSRGEKPQVVIDYNVVTSERAGILAQADAYAITTERSAYDSAVSALITYMAGLSPAYTDASADTTIVQATYRSTWQAVYTTKQALIDRIAAVARLRASDRGMELNPDPYPQDPTAWVLTPASAAAFVGDPNAPGGRAIESAIGQGLEILSRTYFPIESGKAYRFEAWLAANPANTGRAFIGVAWYDSNGVFLQSNVATGSGGAGNPAGWSNGNFSYIPSASNVIPSGSYVRHTAQFGPGEPLAIPANARQFRLVALLNNEPNASARHYIAGIKVAEKANTSLLGANAATDLAQITNQSGSIVVARGTGAGGGAVRRIRNLQSVVWTNNTSETTSVQVEGYAGVSFVSSGVGYTSLDYQIVTSTTALTDNVDAAADASRVIVTATSTSGEVQISLIDAVTVAPGASIYLYLRASRVLNPGDDVSGSYKSASLRIAAIKR